MSRYLVIGAGPSGLLAARVPDRRGIGFDVIERHTDVGGIWDLDNPGTPIYETAHFISSRTRSAFAGFPFPERYPDYPDHEQILAYLRAFADAHDLRPHVTFRTEVTQVRPHDGRWRASLRAVDSGTEHTRTYDGVIMASGNFWTPNLPEIAGSWAGESYHSQEYRSLDQLRGRRVLVVGAGNSGCDIACDAAKVADHASISVRRGYRIVPKHLFGMPTDVFANAGPPLPGAVRQKVFNALLRAVTGDPARFGWPEPDHDVLATHPILNTRIIDHLAHGDLHPRPDVAALEGRRARFVDGSEEGFDLIIWATGYRVSFPYLDPEVLSWRGNDPDLFLNVVSRRHDALFALGILEVDAGAFPIISLQAELIGHVLHDLDHDPRQAEAFRRLKRTRPDLSGGIEHVDSPRHDYYVQDHAYRGYLGALLARLRAGQLDASGVSTGVTGRLLQRLQRRARGERSPAGS